MQKVNAMQKRGGFCMKWLDYLAFTDGYIESRLLKTKKLYYEVSIDLLPQNSSPIHIFSEIY